MRKKASLQLAAPVPLPFRHVPFTVPTRANSSLPRSWLTSSRVQNFAGISPVNSKFWFYRDPFYRWVPINIRTGQKNSHEFDHPRLNRANPAQFLFPRQPTRHLNNDSIIQVNHCPGFLSLNFLPPVEHFYVSL